jgi:hypothetical protein
MVFFALYQMFIKLIFGPLRLKCLEIGPFIQKVGCKVAFRDEIKHTYFYRKTQNKTLWFSYNFYTYFLFNFTQVFGPLLIDCVLFGNYEHIYLYNKRACPQTIVKTMFKILRLRSQRCQIKEANRVAKNIGAREREKERELKIKIGGGGTLAMHR